MDGTQTNESAPVLTHRGAASNAPDREERNTSCDRYSTPPPRHPGPATQACPPPVRPRAPPILVQELSRHGLPSPGEVTQAAHLTELAQQP